MIKKGKRGFRKQRAFEISIKIAQELREKGETQEDIAYILNRSRSWVIKYLYTTQIDTANKQE